MGKSKDLATGNSAFYQDQTESDTRYVNVSGDTMTGNLGVNVSPTAALDVRRSDTDGKIAEFHQSGGYGFELSSSQTVARFRSGYLQAMSITTDAGSGAAERMRISKEGYVTKPNQPAFYAYTTNDGQSSGTYLTSSSSSTNWAESFDNGSNFSDGVFTAPVAGKYYFSVMWNRRVVQSRIAIRKNNSNYMRWEPTGRTDDTWESQQYSVLINMAVNDYVNLYLEYSGTSSYPVHMGTGAWGHFAGYLIG